MLEVRRELEGRAQGIDGSLSSFCPPQVPQTNVNGDAELWRMLRGAAGADEAAVVHGSVRLGDGVIRARVLALQPGREPVEAEPLVQIGNEEALEVVLEEGRAVREQRHEDVDERVLSIG